jgi:hypothetical protein
MSKPRSRISTMRSPMFRLQLLALLCLPLLSTACATASTPVSLARTERAAMPALPPELVKTEHLAPIAAKPAGELVSIDKGVLDELLERFAQAIGAVERGNNRAGGVKALWTCVDAIMRTGAQPAGCKPAPH